MASRTLALRSAVLLSVCVARATGWIAVGGTNGGIVDVGGINSTTSTRSCESSSGPTQNSVNPSAYVQEHNAYRCELGLEPLAWDCELAAVAQKWADHLARHTGCKMQHSSPAWRRQAFAAVGYPEHPGTVLHRVHAGDRDRV